jgi:hypothetical protein
MESSAPRRILVVAHKTAATGALLDAVHERAQRGPCVFTLLVPRMAHGMHKVVDVDETDAGEAQQVVNTALPLLQAAADAPVDAIVGDPDPMAAVQDAINLRSFEEVIVSTLSARMSRWLRLDLPSKIAGLGLPVTTVTAREEAKLHA